MGRRILWLTPAYPSKVDPVGGIYHKTQVDALVRLGAEVKVVSPTPWVPPFLERTSERRSRYKLTPLQYTDGRVKVYRPRYLALPIQNVWGLPYHIWIRQQIEAIGLLKPDLIHAHFAYPQGTLALQMGAFWNIPTVLTLHGSDVNVYPHQTTQNRKRFNEVVVNHTSVIAVSGALAERTKELTKREPLVMPIGVNLAPFDNLPDKTAARHKLGLPPDRFIVLFVGNFFESKGVRELLRSLKILKEDQVVGVFVGEGPLGDEIKSSREAISVGRQRNDLIPQYLAAADVLVLPSHREGLPTVLVEAGAAGVPVIASSVGGIPGLLADHRGRCVPEQSVEALTQAIRGMMKDYGQALADAARLKLYVQMHYNVDLNARSLLDLYDNLIIGRFKAAGSKQIPGGGVHES